MNNLEQLVLLTTGKVEVKGGDPITVRGLSPADLMALIDRHRATANKMFDELAGDQGTATIMSPSSMAAKFFADAPNLVADVISVAMDCPDSVAVIQRLPTGLQIKLVEEIIRVTAFVEGGLGELLETVIAAAVQTSGVVGKLNGGLLSTDGSVELGDR